MKSLNSVWSYPELTDSLSFLVERVNIRLRRVIRGASLWARQRALIKHNKLIATASKQINVKSESHRLIVHTAPLTLTSPSRLFLNMSKKFKLRYIWLVILLLLMAGIAKFYHYNYVANTRGQARTINLDGLREFVCKGRLPVDYFAEDQCGKRSIWIDPDWGITAYYSIYGVESKEEAQAIADFMVAARKKAGQERIPMNLEVYSLPRSQGNRYNNHKIFDKDL